MYQDHQQKSTEDSEPHNHLSSHIKWQPREQYFDDSFNDLSLHSMNSQKLAGPRQLSILICTDFSFPKFGGVETHGYQLAQCLIERGHKVCFVTNKF
jgi:hypothetical protein